VLKKNGFKLTANLSKLIDTEHKIVTSVTAEQQLDYRTGIFTMNTPKAKAMSGFINPTGRVNFEKTVTIQSQNEYLTIELVSMDGKDIEESRKMLLQIGTIFRPTNWKEEPTTIKQHGKPINRFKIINTGKMPWLGMPLVKTTVSVKNTVIKKATQLDAAGYAIKTLPLEFIEGGLRLNCPEDSYYILLEL
jgi:hypothetical protein